MAPYRLRLRGIRRETGTTTEKYDDDEGEGGDDDGKGEKPLKASKAPKEAKKPKEGKVDQWHSSMTTTWTAYLYRSPSQNSSQDRDLTPYKLKTSGKPLQVIVKLINIEITATLPKYTLEGTWRVKDLANEKIGTKHLYGIKNNDHPVTALGRDYQQTRSLPGIPQHLSAQVFSADPDTAFFFSSCFVPTQQKGWDNRPSVEEVNKKLSPEQLREVDQMADWPTDLEEAKRHRANLMVERCYFSETFNTNLLERPFSLCEHLISTFSSLPGTASK
ncbi:hypothetical protein KI688_000840 [Linnemannia hyalina]|uniref:DUF4246 domain-containing protein n=1 Tax=Linnemannia hyalina TaxID=64524 RepID=A0A9P7Y6E6_9FUNG|nr:hypothetical protein KI688_000840 [Linnemannia hyalina]